MFGHSAWMNKKGCYIETGDFSGGNGGVADSQESGVEGDGLEQDGEGQGDTGDETGADEGEAGVVDQQEKASKQTPEQDAAFAKLRREADEARREVAKRDQWVSNTFGQSHGIHTWDQYQAAVAQTQQQQAANQERQRMEQAQAEYGQLFNQLKEQGYDPDFLSTLDRAMSKHPRLQQLEQANSQLQQALNGVMGIHQQEKQQQENLKRVNESFNELKGEYPEYKNLDEFAQKIGEEAWNKIVEKYQKGYSLLDAHESINRQEIKKKTASAAKQKTLNEINSKSHLKVEGGDGAVEGGDLSIPSDTLQMYMDQGMTKKQATAFHKKLYG